MRKNTTFTVAAVIMGLAVIFWARSSLLGTSSDTRSTVGTSFYPVETAGRRLNPSGNKSCRSPICSLEAAWLRRRSA